MNSHEQANQVVILVNPKAGGSSSADRVARLGELLRQRGFEPTVFDDLGAAADVANRWHAGRRLRALVAVGGDGTAAEIVNRTVAGMPLTLLPAGNENLLARYLGLNRSLEELCQTISDGETIRLDAARAGNRIFLLMLSCGFDAEVVYRVHRRRTGHVRHLDYIKPILDVMRSYAYPALRVRSGGGVDLPFRWLFVFNLPCYARGLCASPKACGADGRLDVCGFASGGIWKGLGYAAAIACGRHQRLRDWQCLATERLTVTADVPVHYQIDGDPGGMLPIDVEVLPERLTLLVPRGSRHVPTSQPLGGFVS
jgi:diacylglycerol kinase family enzyme